MAKGADGDFWNKTLFEGAITKILKDAQINDF